MNPVILVVSDANAASLDSEFGRYSRDDDLRVVSTVDDALSTAREVADSDAQLALVVIDSSLFPTIDPSDVDGGILAAMRGCRQAVPTARILVVAPFERFLADSEVLRAAQAQGRFEAVLLLPRGARDEEFHSAVTELLSDWSASACRSACSPPTPTAVARSSPSTAARRRSRWWTSCREA